VDSATVLFRISFRIFLEELILAVEELKAAVEELKAGKRRRQLWNSDLRQFLCLSIMSHTSTILIKPLDNGFQTD
jgi:hypothetical protein